MCVEWHVWRTLGMAFKRAWCFRVPPEQAYDHASFVATLERVVNGATLVVWLPRSRTDEMPVGSYEFRLW